MPKKKKEPRVQNLTVYLGVGRQRSTRIARLDDLAEKFFPGEKGSRSRLIQAIADGRLGVVPIETGN